MARIQDAVGNPVLENVAATGAFAALNDEALVTIFGQAVAAVQVASLAGSITISFEGSVDGTNYQAVTGIRPADGTTGTSTTADGVWTFAVGGYKKFRARVSAVAGGTADVAVNAGQGSVEAPFGGTVTLSAADIEIGAVEIKNGTDDTRATVTAGNALKVDGSAVTQPVSAATLPLPTGAATSALQLPNSHDVTVDNAGGGAAVNIQDGGNSITIDGTITATPSGTQDVNLIQVAGTAVTVGSGVLGAGTQRVVLATDQPVVPVSDNGGSLTVDAATLPLPTGASTSALQLPDGHNVTVDNAAGAAAVNIQDGGNSITVDGTVSVTEPVSVDDNGGSLTVDGTVAVSGTVAISAAALPLPAGAATSALQLPDGHNVTVDNAAGAAAVNIQDGGNSITIDGTITATAAGQAADGAAVVGNPVRIGGKDGGGLTQDIITDASGVLAIQDNGGSITIDAASLPLPTGASTLAGQTQPGVDIGDVTVNNAAGAAAVNVQDGGNSLTIDAASLPLPTGAATSALQTQPGVDIGDVTINNAAGAAAVNIQDGGNSITVDGTVAVSGAVDTELPAAAALADAAANPTAPAVGAFNMVWNGATWDRLMGNAAGGAEVQGSVANGVADVGNPVGGGAQARTTNPTAVTDGQRVTLKADKLGRQVVAVGQVRDLISQNNITLTTTTETTLLASVASTFLDLTGVIISNTSGTAVRVDFRDATAGTVRFSIMVAANGGGGIFVPIRPVKQTAVTNNWTAQLSAAVTDVRIFAQAEQNL